MSAGPLEPKNIDWFAAPRFSRGERWIVALVAVCAGIALGTLFSAVIS